MSNCILWAYDARNAERFGKSLTAVQRAILIVSDPLTHMEYQFSERYGKVSFSSTIQDGDKGVRFKDIRYSHPERWVPILLPMTNEQEDRGHVYAKSIEGKDYDLVGVASLASKWKIIKPHPDKYWCNEATGGVIQVAYGYGLEFRPDEMHPVDLFFVMYRLTHGIITLLP